MAKAAVEFVAQGTKLHLVYRPDIRDPEHLRIDLAKGKLVTIKGTYHLTEAYLFKGRVKRDPNDWEDDDLVMRFVVAKAEGKYFVFDPAVLNVDVPVMVARDSRPTWKWFTAEERTSVMRRLAELRPTRIVIGGPLQDAIPVAEYEKLINQFPSPHEMRLYVQSRLAVVFRELTDANVDAGEKLGKYVAKRVKVKPKDLIQPFRQLEVSKYEFLHSNLLAMLQDDAGMPERQWQAQILDIVRLLNPKYIAAFASVTIKDSLTGGHRQVDIMLVDVNGHVDVIEIKKPFDARIVTTTTYRDNHVPHRELVGTVMQVEKYLFHMSRWGTAGEDALTKRYRAELPPQLKLRIVNPCGLIIMGRDDDLTTEQRGDFEMYRRQHKNVIDVVTYDDLLRRLERVLQQLKAGR
ncbi:Shedu immune nuclease family protein [Variovorax sp. dw_308]|uniref:Shedu immune nuclease family protein n=1 Tax=Variovorax sp. dw_308 TaxID=2721546 RepID=UPI001C48075F|nr:Shedu immune nuclease family protein [Variovorax sp. dw_308]